MNTERAAKAASKQPMRPRRVPQRTCVGCRSTSAKRGFVRVVRTPDGHVRVDPTGKANGRGAYLCASPGCWEAGIRRGKLAQSLRVTLSDDDRRDLLRYAESLPPDSDVPLTN